MISRRFVATGVLALAAILAPPETAHAKDPFLPSPGLPGPYHVAYASITIPVSAMRIAAAAVWYPTSAAPDCAHRYTVRVVRPPPIGRVDSYTLGSPLCAVEGTPVADPGGFPLIVFDHGGNMDGVDLQRWSQFPLMEHLASHGFVVVVALHVANPGVRATDLHLVIDEMLRRNDVDPLLAGAIDPERIGLSGVSAGGGTAVATAAGWPARNIAPESRARAMLVYEPDPGSYSVADTAAMEIPYLLMHGDQFALSVPSYTILLATTTAAAPRIEVYSPGAIHRNNDTGLCRIIDDAREQALLADRSLPDPLTHFKAGNAAAEAAYNNWNIGVTQFPLLGAGVGGGRNICNRVGVHSAVLPLDADGDELTDAPPFMPLDPPYVLAVPPTYEVIVPRILLYSVAFWKTFLEGDHRYMPYLTPSFASHRMGTVVTIWE